MQHSPSYLRQWTMNVRADVLAGIVVALALIPEAIGFSAIAGVDPKVGLYASFAIACVAAVVGGRPGMISAATAATAVVMVSLVRDHGLQYLFAATILMGLIQIAAGFLKVGRIMRFVSRSVITGFVNALAILIFMAQLPELVGVPTLTYPMVAAGLAIIYLFPRLTKAIPSPLVAIAILTAFAWAMGGLHLRTVGDLGELPSDLPAFGLPDVPLTLETLKIIFPYSMTLAAVGLLESLLTAQIVDDMTDTLSNKSQECVGQGTGNIASALIGGMGGCAMIGQSVINVSSGGRGRLSTFVAGAFLLFLILVLDDFVRIIPMAALVAVMIMVSINTFSWRSILDLRHNPRSSSVVMLATVATVVGTHNLANGVLVGVLLSGVFFAGKVSRLVRVDEEEGPEGRMTYRVVGQIFFASAETFLRNLDFEARPKEVVIDLTHAHLWDITSIGALDKAVLKFRRNGAQVEVLGLNEASATMVDRFASHDKAEPQQSAAH